MRNPIRTTLAPLLLGAALAACHSPGEQAPKPPADADSAPAAPVVREAFVTASRPQDNLDSVAAWHDADGGVRLYVTAKKTDLVRIYDGADGHPLGQLGGRGDGAGQMRRPNGIAVAGDRLYVVERDTHRVQVFALPGNAPLGTFGSDVLKKPYGLWVRGDGDAATVYVSDDWAPQGTDDADAHKQVLRFEVRIGDTLQAKPSGQFGAASGVARLHVVESLVGDPAEDRLLVADEYEAPGSRLKVYDLDGRYRGRDVGAGVYRHQAEGFALYACADGGGYWIGSDQSRTDQRYLVFDRDTLAYLGAVQPAQARNTDGVWLDQRASARFPAGVFYAVHDDHAVAAFDWRDIAGALKLRSDCTATD